MSLLFWHFINTTAHYLTDTSLHLPLLKSSMDKVIQINMSLSQIDWYWTLQSRINIEILNTKPPDLMDNLLITFENCTFYMSNFFFEKVFSSRPRKGVIWRVVHTAPNHFRQKNFQALLCRTSSTFTTYERTISFSNSLDPICLEFLRATCQTC